MTARRKPRHDPSPAAAPAAEGTVPPRPAEDAIDFGPLPSTLGYVLRRTQLAVFQSFHRTFAQVDLRPAQYTVLTMIGRNPGLKQSQVSEALGIKRANFVALLDSLEERGLARREAIASDRRSYALFLTKKGEALARKAARMVEQHERQLGDRIGHDNAQTLLELLHRLAQAATEDTEGPADGDPLE
jgi:DNA-binding MarR family transcriptional regulator